MLASTHRICAGRQSNVVSSQPALALAKKAVDLGRVVRELGLVGCNGVSMVETKTCERNDLNQSLAMCE